MVPGSDSAFVEVLIDPVVKQAFRELVNSQLNRLLAGLSSDNYWVHDHSITELTGKEMTPIKCRNRSFGCGNAWRVPNERHARRCKFYTHNVRRGPSSPCSSVSYLWPATW